MSLQHFLVGRVHGISGFLEGSSLPLPALLSRTRWLSLLCETAPRALLQELQLSPLLLGGVAGSQFLLVLPTEFLAPAAAWLDKLQAGLDEASGGRLRLVYGHTENLGPWPVVQKRLDAALRQARLAPGAAVLETRHTPFRHSPVDGFWKPLLEELAKPSPQISCNLETPGLLSLGQTSGSFALAGKDGIPCSRAVAVDTQHSPSPEALQSHAKGRKRWGILVADLDNVRARLEGLGSIEEYLQTSLSLKNFVAGELEVAAAKAPFAGQLTLLYSGGDDFAVAGPWDKLLDFVSQMRRLFDTFLSQSGAAGSGLQRTISAAITVAEPGEHASAVLARSQHELELVKASGKNAIFLFESILDWPQLQEAATLRTQMARLMERHAGSAAFLVELEEFYSGLGGSGVTSVRGRRRGKLLDKPWRLHRNLRRAANARETGSFEKDWNKLFATMTAVGSGGRRELRPTGRVAIEWTRLHTGRG